MNEKILILDFGSQYTQLIARCIREHQVYCEIQPYDKPIQFNDSIKGLILSGSPCSVNDENPLQLQLDFESVPVPILGICYGAQLIAKNYGAEVKKSSKREYGRAELQVIKNGALFNQIPSNSTVWMSHSDSIVQHDEQLEVLATTSNIPVAAYKLKSAKKPDIFGLQFHPEVYHSQFGKQILANFLFELCSCSGNWTAAHFITNTVAQIKETVGNKKVLMALSGGVDSTVAATLISQAIGNNLIGVFVNNGLLRKDENKEVVDLYKQLNINVINADAEKLFLDQLHQVSDPETKRKIIGKTFIEVFDNEAKKLNEISYLGQGTIYPDVIESVSVHGPSQTIKSHHNVGGLPEKMNLQLIEPLRFLFKDEVRKIGLELGIPNSFIQRHPFPGPGLAIRILGEITPEKISILQKADKIYTDGLKQFNLYHEVWQAGAILLPVKSVGVMGDERTYEYTLALRAVTSVDGMTADWAHLPFEFLSHISNEIINSVQGINRVVYDISSKPPASIEWE